jgi:hypothetical protein
LRASLAVGLHAGVALAGITLTWGIWISCCRSLEGVPLGIFTRRRRLILCEGQNGPQYTNGNCETSDAFHAVLLVRRSNGPNCLLFLERAVLA